MMNHHVFIRLQSVVRCPRAWINMLTIDASWRGNQIDIPQQKCSRTPLENLLIHFLREIEVAVAIVLYDEIHEA